MRIQNLLEMQFMLAMIVAQGCLLPVAVAVGFEAMSGKCNATLIGRS